VLQHAGGAWRSIEVVNLAENGREDLVADLVAIVSSFCARLYGQRRAKRKAEAIVQELTRRELTGQEAPVVEAREEERE
jgi:predicted site-specific integrase-resolvase